MFDPERVRLGITPTGWTNDDFPTLGDEIGFEQCVSEIALAGFQGCSVGHKFPRDPHELRSALDLRGLQVSEPWASTYFTINQMRERTFAEFREQMAFMKAVGGAEVVVAELGHAIHQQPVALLANKPELDDTQWQAMLHGLDELGHLAAEEGMRLSYHHHMGTVVQSREDVDRLMAGTDPDVVHLLIDTGHITWAGGDPLAVVRDHAGRIAHVHLKDIRPDVMDRSSKLSWSFLESVTEGIFTVPGDGIVDFPPILEALADAGYEGWLMVEAEQDPAKAHPLTHAKKARRYLRDVTGL